MRLARLGLLGVAALTAIATPEAQHESDAARDGLLGPVRVVKTESAYAMRAGDGYAPNDRPTSRGTVTYDAAGNYVVREVVDDYGFPVGTETFTYANGRLTGAQLVDPKGGVLERRVYAYGASPQYEKVTITSGSGRAYEEHYRRAANHRIEAIRYVSGTKEVGTTAFTYGSAPGKPDEVKFFLPGGRRATAPVGPCLGAHRVVYRYRDGRVVERRLYEEDGSLKRTSSLTYDDRGNVIEEARAEGPSKSTFRYEYGYDGRGNWIRRVETIRREAGGTPEPPSTLARLTTRTITYR